MTRPDATRPDASGDENSLAAQAGKPATGVREALAAALRAALATRDRPAAAALRSALAAIGNAEAVSGDAATATAAARPGRSRIAGASAGLGSTEVPRRVLSPTATWDIVSAEIAERRQAARHYADAGHPTRADRLTAEADVLEAVVTRFYRPAAAQRDE